jgi:DNA-binding response OmpR family regulator
MACILIADDEMDMLKVRTILLQMEGYTILTANDGVEAFDLALKNPIDLIVTDWMMPRLNGIGLCQKLRENDSTKNIPIILASGVDIVPEGMHTLYDAFLPKLATIDELIHLIGQLLDNDVRKG